ncbi:MAG: transporter substrate-binding domain-containing protein [Desulfobacterales bacterium]|nr:transporter substrate-binding domain-containing protein [Desulfobacterales bacterium]
MKKLFLISATVLCLVVLTVSVSVAEQLRIVTIQMAPFGFFTKDKKSTGMLYDIGGRIAKEAGFSYKNKIVPFARMIKNLKDGDADYGIFFVSEANSKVAKKVARVIPLENIIIGLKGTEIKSLKDLHGKKVARVRNAKYDETFASDSEILKYDTNNYQDSIKILLRKRVYAMIGPRTGLFFAAKKMGHSEDSFGIPLILNTKDTWLQYSRKTSDDKKIAALKTATEKLLKDDTIQSLVDKYLK